MSREIINALDSLKALKKRADERAQQLMEEIVELEDYSKRLEPIIELVEKMPELGESLCSLESNLPRGRGSARLSARQPPGRKSTLS